MLYIRSLGCHLIYWSRCPCQPDVITPDTIATPQGAYGMGKLVCELFINEYTRRGFIDGRILRLPTIVVRPGPPSAATSAFVSGTCSSPALLH